MALADYVGRSPVDGPEESQIERVTAHHVWALDQASTAACANCGGGIDLDERHLLVRLVSRSRTPRVDRRYLCDEGCVQEWVEG
ncbi:MAG: hypothetical protein ABEJ43_02920 [Haloferacaceae archaeon]